MPLSVWNSALGGASTQYVEFAKSGFRQCLRAKQATNTQIQLLYYTESKLFPQRLCSVLAIDVKFPIKTKPRARPIF